MLNIIDCLIEKKLTQIIKFFQKKLHKQSLNNLEQRCKWMVENNNVKMNEQMLLRMKIYSFESKHRIL